MPVRALALRIALAGLAAGCQSRSEFLLENGRASIARDLANGEGYSAAFDFEKVDAQLRIERRPVDGVPAKEARARFHAFVAGELLRAWERLDCLDTDREKAMLATVAPADAALAAKWSAKQAACAQAGATAREARRLDLLERTRGQVLVVYEAPLDRVFVACAAVAVKQATGLPAIAVEKAELNDWDLTTGGDASALSGGRATVTVERHRVTRETRKVLSNRLVSTEAVTVALGTSVDIAVRGRAPWKLEAGWSTAETGRDELQPLTISQDADLWPYLCQKLEAAARAHGTAP